MNNAELSRDAANGARRIAVEVTIETITPHLASMYLAKNTDNRPVRTSRITHLARLMRNGEWRLAPDSIAFDDRGTLINGQHRLRAVVLSEVACAFIVARGFPRDTFLVTDAGAKRSTADALAISHAASGSFRVAASAISLVIKYHEGKITNAYSANTTTPAQIVEYAKANPHIDDSVRFGGRLSKIVAPSVAAFAHHLFHSIDAVDAGEFCSLLETGEGLCKGHPAHTLREKLITNRGSLAKLRQEHVAAYMIRAWNAFRRGEELKILRWSTSDPFPDAV